jgi:hypothetical protein
LRAAHARVAAAQVQNRGHADRVDDRVRGHHLDRVEIDLLVSGVDATANMHPGAIVGRIGATTIHCLAFAPLTEGGRGGALLGGDEDLFLRKLHDAVRLGAIRTGLGEQVHGRCKNAVGQIIIGVDKRLFVPLDPVPLDDSFERRHKALHVVVDLAHQRADLGTIKDRD